MTVGSSSSSRSGCSSLSSGTLLSGLHRYAGDQDHLKLRLLFTDHALLATRPRFRMNEQTNQIYYKNTTTHTMGIGNRQTPSESSPAVAQTTRPQPSPSTPNENFHSSYLIKKSRRFGWTITPEVKSCPLKRQGLELRVTSCYGSVCSSCANKDKFITSIVDDRGGVRRDFSGGETTAIDPRQESSNGTNKLIKEAVGYKCKSERASNWKDTIANVTSDKNNEWKRTMARKLPSEMRNHNQQYHHHNAVRSPTKPTIVGLSKQATAFDEGGCSVCCLCGGSSSNLETESMFAEPKLGDGCQQLTDWYQRQLLNKNETRRQNQRNARNHDDSSSKNLAASVSIPGDGNNVTKDGPRCEFDSDKDDTTNFNTHREPDDSRLPLVGLVPLTGAKLDSSKKGNKDILNGGVSDATTLTKSSPSEEDEIKKQQRQPMDDNFRPTLKSQLGPRCSLVEILYITMENHEISGDRVATCASNVGAEGESFVLSPMTTNTNVNASSATNTTTTTTTVTSIILTDKGIINSSNNSSTEADATVSAKTNMDRKFEIDDKFDAPEATNKNQQQIHPNNASKSLNSSGGAASGMYDPRDEIRSDVERNRYQDDDDKSNEHGDDDRQQQQRAIETSGEVDKFNYKGTTNSISGNNSKSTFVTATATNAYDDDDNRCSSESSDKDEEDKIGNREQEQINNLRSDRQDRLMLNNNDSEILNRRDKPLANDGESAGRVEFCVAVIVIDKLNRLIQMKPDLNKLISVDICAEFGFCGPFVGVGKISSDTSSGRMDIGADTHGRVAPANANHGTFSRASQRATQIQCDLLYRLELVGENYSRKGSSTLRDRSEAKRHLDLLYGRLFSKPREHARAAAAALVASGRHLAPLSTTSHRGFFNPTNGGILIKLQFDIHYASDFPKDCRNLYVKYKLLSKLRGSQWKLGRRRQQPLAATVNEMRVKDEKMWQGQKQQQLLLDKTLQATSKTNDGKQLKLEQMSHLITSAATNAMAIAVPNQQQIINSSLANSSNNANYGGDEAKKPGTKSTLTPPTTMVPSETSGVMVDRLAIVNAFGGQKQPSEPMAVGGEGPITEPDTCLLEGSTITSEPDSRGRFHFACVEELVLELVACSNNKWHKPPLNHHRSHPLSSRPLSATQQTNSSRQVEQKSFELTSTLAPDSVASEGLQDAIVDRNNKDLANQLRTNAIKFLPNTGADIANSNSSQTIPETATSSGARSSVSEDDGDENTANNSNQVIIIKETDNDNCANNYESTKISQTSPSSSSSSSSHGNNQSTTTTNEQQRASANDDGDKCKNGSRERNRASKSSSSDGSSCGNCDNGDLEIVLLFEFYSSNFYRDKLQGWSYLGIPVNLDTITDNKQTIANCTTNQIHLNNAIVAEPRKGNHMSMGSNHVLPVIMPELCSILDKLRYYLIGQLPTSVPPLESFARSNHRYMMLTRQSGRLVLNCEVVRQLSSTSETENRHLYNGIDLNSHIIGRERTVAGFNGAASGDGNEDGELDTHGVVEAYRRARHRIDRLKMNSLFTN